MNWIKRLLNTSYLKARVRVEGTVPFWPIAWIERLQRYRLRAIIQHAYRSVPFYRQAMDERGLRPSDFRTVEDLARLPLIDGKTVQRNSEAFLSTRYGDESRLAWYSSGSTSGIRRVIYWDRTSVLNRRVDAARVGIVLQNLVGQRRFVHVHVAPSGSTRLKLRRFYQASTFSSPSGDPHHVLSPEEPYEIIAQRINTIDPQVVSSYASFAEQFFRFLADRQMSISLPRLWIYGGEMLSPSAKDLIENTFGCRTYSAYQATETGILGFQCEKREGFHLNVDLCGLRLVDEEGRTVQAGTPGEVVISNLHNRATVLLNYRLEDRAVLAQGSCTCGRSLPLLESLEGRSSETLDLGGGRGFSALTLETHCLRELRHTLGVQFVQRAPGDILWRIVPSSAADPEALRRSLLERCRAVLGEDTHVEVEFVDEIPSTPQGKSLRVISESRAPDRRKRVTEER
jgi:phenylacetate-CoA ligase